MACGNCAQLWTAPGALLFDTMGLFDDMKARMEKFSKDVDKAISGKPKTGPGHTLGGAAEAGEGFVFRSDRPLGMTLTKGDDLRAHVNSVVPGGQAEAKGVAAGWVVASLDGADLGYDGFMDAFTAAKASGRALKVGFRRVLPRAAATTSRARPRLASVVGHCATCMDLHIGDRIPGLHHGCVRARTLRGRRLRFCAVRGLWEGLQQRSNGNVSHLKERLCPAGLSASRRHEPY